MCCLTEYSHNYCAISFITAVEWVPPTLIVILYCICQTVKQILKDERKYYEDLLKYSREHLMLYPYHLSDVVVKGLRITPFSYYTSMMAEIMTQEKSYDSLPNFTAADCTFTVNDYIQPFGVQR